MEKRTVSLYTFDELGKGAQKHAIKKEHQAMLQQGYLRKMIVRVVDMGIYIKPEDVRMTGKKKFRVVGFTTYKPVNLDAFIKNCGEWTIIFNHPKIEIVKSNYTFHVVMNEDTQKMEVEWRCDWNDKQLDDETDTLANAMADEIHLHCLCVVLALNNAVKEKTKHCISDRWIVNELRNKERLFFCNGNHYAGICEE